MQIVETDSIRPQNKVGLHIGVSDPMFLNNIHLSKEKNNKKAGRIFNKIHQLLKKKKKKPLSVKKKGK